ncbi:MAG: aldose 1-epimerase family protein [Armatimonadetes bacterium]|nr:aldose 1-epimerase family protein [Armatimonadota bacterium]
MARIFGHILSRTDLLRQVGDISQIGGVREVRLQGGKEDGVRALEFRTGTGLEFDVLADRAMDISRCTYKGASLAWRSGAGDQHPSFYSARGAEWLWTFQGGLFATCGLAQAGAPNTDAGEDLGVHGRIGATAATELCAREWWDGEDYILQASGKIREGRLFGYNLLLERTISTRIGSSTIRVNDKVTNEGFEPAPHMILYHVNAGFPVLSPESRVYAPSLECLPRDNDAEVEADRWMEMLPPTAGFAERVYAHKMQPDEDGFVSVTMVNPDFQGRPFGMRLRYSHTTLPWFNQWKMLGQGAYVCGLEPANCQTLGRSAERRAGRLVELEPWEEREYELEISVIDGDEEFRSAREAASLEGA